MNVSVRFSSVSPTSLASSISFSSVRRVRNSLRASAATSPFAASTRRSSRPASRSRDCKRSTVPRILSINRFFSNGLKSIPRISTEISTRVRDSAHFAFMYGFFFAFAVLSSFSACFSAKSYSFAILSMYFSVCFVLLAIFSSVSSSSSNCTISLMERPLAQIVAHRNQFLDDDRRARDGLHHDELAALDALGDGDFAFAGEQRDGAHLAQVHANGVVGFFERARSQIQVAVGFVCVFLGVTFAGHGGHFDGTRGFGRGLILVNFNAVAFKCREKVVDFFRGMHFRRKGIVYFVIQQVAALFADGDELAYCIIFFFKTDYCHKILPQSDDKPIRFGADARDSQTTLRFLPRHEQADAQAQTEGGFPHKIACFFGRCAVTLNVERNPLPCAACCRSPRASPAYRVSWSDP